MYSKQTNLKGAYSWKKMSLNSLVMLKCEGKTSLHAVQFKWQPDYSDLLFLFLFYSSYPRHFVLFVLWDSKPGFDLSLLLIFLPKSRLLFFQNFSYKKSVLTCIEWIPVKKTGKFKRFCIPNMLYWTSKFE